MSLEAKIKALLEGKQDDAALLSEEELVESVVEVDEEGNPITEAKKEDDKGEKEDDNEANDKDDKDEKECKESAEGDEEVVSEELKKDADKGSAEDNAKIKAGLSKKLEAGGEIKAASTDEPNNKRNNVKTNMQEHIDALTSGEDLSEEFKSKATTIFEAAVSAGVAEEVARLEEEHAQKLDEAVDAVRAQLVEDIDGFLNDIVENWMKANELALERGIKVDIVENFIDGMKDLFKEHYIEVPEEKLNILDEQAEQIETLEATTAELTEQVETLTKQVNESNKALAIENVGADLADTDFEKFRGLAEKIEYSEDYEEKITTILESYFPKAKVNSTEDSGEVVEATKVDENSSISKYVQALSSGQLKF